MKRKFLLSVLLATIFLAAQIMVVGAAPAAQDTTPITGTVESIVLETDETDTTTAVVMFTDEFGETQTIRISLEDAIALGLVTDDGSGPVVDESKVGTEVIIDPTLVIPDETMDEEEQHPVGSALSDFFTDLLGVNYEMIMDYHEEGTGFGVIAQALWMTNALTSDDGFETELTPDQVFAAILDAKKDKDFSAITLPDGSEPTNWGQFRKAIMADRKKSKENLGAIMSGRAEVEQADDELTEPMSLGQSLDSNGTEKSNNGKNNENKANGKEKNKDKGNGKGKKK